MQVYFDFGGFIIVFKRFYGLLLIVLLTMCCMGSVCAQVYNGSDYFNDLGFKHFEGKTDFMFAHDNLGNLTYVVKVVIPHFSADLINFGNVIRFNAKLGNELFANGTITDDLGEGYADMRHIPRPVYDDLYHLYRKYIGYYEFICDYIHGFNNSKSIDVDIGF
jgi:hypothetical protein